MAAESDVLSEIEVLESIYLDELQVSRTEDGGWAVSLVLYPSTAEETVSQFVRLTLTLTLDLQYPSSPPSISIHNPRGLSDDKLRSVQRCLQSEAESCLGSPVLYQLIEKAKEILTESNIPHGNCVICLYGFKEDEAFTKTGCYHYFHSHCLGRYVTHSERELRERERELEEDKTRERTDEELAVVCPVCRAPLLCDADQLLSSPAPCGPKLEGELLGADFRHKWRRLQKLLERQRAKGGIIDPEAESNRFLIHINEPPADGEHDNPDTDACPSLSAPAAPPPVPSNEPSAHRDHRDHRDQPHRRGGPGHRRPNQLRGPRRGGGGRGGRPHHGRPAAPPTEQLDRLSLASDGVSTEPAKTRLQLHQGRPELGTVELNPAEKPDRKCSVEPNREEAPPFPADKPETCRPCPPRAPTDDDGCLKDGGGESVHVGGSRGRRRAPRRPWHQQGHWQDRRCEAPRDHHHHQWDGRGSERSGGPGGSGGPGQPCSRGGGPPRRGHGRGLHQRATEREAGREGVL